MLSPLDDYPIHQIAEPIRHVGTSDRNFYDRYYFNLHASSRRALPGDGARASTRTSACRTRSRA